MESRDKTHQFNGSEIAIIGIACRLPQANDLDEFWANLKNGVESITYLSDDEIETAGLDPADPSNPDYIKAASFLRDVDLFDAPFFGFTPAEAEIMDPQHRLFLECSWEALEHAGYDPERYPGAIGVFAGARTNTYLYNLISNPDLVRRLGPFHIGLANDLGFLSTRISYKLNLKGPSYSIHTACSTSLVAIHLACQSLLIDECQIALAGGVVVNVPQKTGYFYQRNGITSPDGHCRAFDAKGEGTIFGSGAGVVVLKRLEDALSDGDHIYALIKGSAINNDGAAKASFTAPSVQGQMNVIVDALTNAGVGAETISYIEAHGTATPIGDVIEMRALTKAFEKVKEKRRWCAIGSLKTNIGHLDAAAGVASLMKTVLALKHRLLPASLHFEEPNPQIDFDNGPFYVNSELTVWKEGSTPRRAGVSSFGVGGTNAHVILEEAPATEAAAASEARQILVLSARTETALEEVTHRLIGHLKGQPEINLADVAHTLQVGRKAFDYRRVAICQDVAEAVQALETLNPQQVFTAVREASDRPVVFLFPGGGAQYAGMGADLYRSIPLFRGQIDACAEMIEDRFGYDPRRYLYPHQADPAAPVEQLQSPSTALPILFMVEYALARLWMSWGVRPQAMIGHSLGEYVAACLAGVFTLEDAVSLVAHRGQLIERLPRGGMLSVSLPEKEVKRLIDGRLAIAANNGPALCVVSGAISAIEDAAKLMEERGVEFRHIQMNAAGHSEMVEPVLGDFGDFVRTLDLRPPQIPFISNITGAWISADQATDPSYWVRHLREKVEFGRGIQELSKDPTRIFLEVGPGRTLSTLVKLQTDKTRAQTVFTSLRHPLDIQPDEATLLTAAGKLWLAGVEIDWQGYRGETRPRRVPLPTYPFERRRYWVEPNRRYGTVENRQPKMGKNPNLTEWFYLPSWKRAPLLKTPDGVQKAAASSWMVLMDDMGLGRALADRLEAEGGSVIRVRAGEGFIKESDESYTIDPRRAEDYEDLLRQVRMIGRPIDTIACLWGLTPRMEPQMRSEGARIFKDAQERGYYSLLFLARALAANGFFEDIQLSIILNNLHLVESGDEVYPEKATILGPCKVIPQEHPNITCRCIDIEPPSSGRQRADEIASQILSEIKAAPSDLSVAYRGRQRWVQIHEPVRIDGQVEPVRPLRENGVYLITGGLGGVGLILAEYLAETYRAKLILTGRTALPEREEWEAWLSAHGEDGPTSRKIRRALRLEELGGEVLALSADVADEDQLRRVVAEATARFGQINGILHAAGVTSGESVFRPLTEIGRSESEAQFQPKVYGVYVLEKVFSGKKLDFGLLFSSNASVLGGMGFVAYSASNAFMDAFAASHRDSGLPWISANWDHWPEETRQYQGVQTSMDQYTMTIEESHEAFRRIVISGLEGQIIVSLGDLIARHSLWINRDFSRPDSAEGAGSAAPAHARPEIQSDYVEPRNETEQTIAEIWSEVLGITPIGIHDNFFDLGGHSLLATRIISRLSNALQVDLPLRKLFEGPTIFDLAIAANNIREEQERQDTLGILNELAQLSEERVEEELRKR